MQVLEQPTTNKEITSYSNEEGHFIETFGISTKRNDNNWAISKKTGHDKVKQFQDRDFAIIPQMLDSPTKGHYFGNDTEPDLLSGYGKHSQGKIIKIKGPYNYNDGTDDYFYNFVIKLRDSKAAALLSEYGPKMWIPFSISPHIMPLSGPDWEIDDWHAIGTALVKQGAYGGQAIVSKFCTGSASTCEKSLGASAALVPCEKADEESAIIISSLVSKTASTQLSMAENVPNTVTNAPVPALQPTQQAELKAEPSIAPVNQITTTTDELERRITEAINKEKALWQEKVTALETKDKINTLNIVFAKVKDQAVKEALIKKYQTEDADLVKRIADDIVQHLATEEEKTEEKPATEEPKEGKKSKAASVELPKEPDVPKEETKESKAAATTNDSPAQLIHNFIMGGR